MSEHLDHEVANHANLIRDLMEDVRSIKTSTRTAGGIIVPNLAPGPGSATVSRVEFNRVRDALVQEIEGLKGNVAKLADMVARATGLLDILVSQGMEAETRGAEIDGAIAALAGKLGEMRA